LWEREGEEWVEGKWRKKGKGRQDARSKHLNTSELGQGVCTKKPMIRPGRGGNGRRAIELCQRQRQHCVESVSTVNVGKES
jgi:hypothetical protein